MEVATASTMEAAAPETAAPKTAALGRSQVCAGGSEDE
jgi:hypothetical protein